MTTREEYDTYMQEHQIKCVTRKKCAVDRLMTLHQTLYKKHGFIFVQHLLRVMNYEQLEEVLGAIDHE